MVLETDVPVRTGDLYWQKNREKHIIWGRDKKDYMYGNGF